MATANFDARGAGRDQRTGDAQIFFAAQQTVGIGEFKSQAQYGRDRGEGDITLIPGQAHAQYLLALPFAHADDAAVRDGAGVRARFRTGQRKARNFLTTRQARQIVVFLLFSTVMLQQFARA